MPEPLSFSFHPNTRALATSTVACFQGFVAPPVAVSAVPPQICWNVKPRRPRASDRHRFERRDQRRKNKPEGQPEGHALKAVSCRLLSRARGEPEKVYRPLQIERRPGSWNLSLNRVNESPSFPCRSDRESVSLRRRGRAFHRCEVLRGTTPRVHRRYTGVARNPMDSRFASCRRRNPS